MRYIGDNAFYNCHNIKNVHINNLSAWCRIYFEHAYGNPLCYAENLYLNGDKITELVIPNNITEINQYAFCNYIGTTNVIFHENISKIGEGAFAGCKNVTSIYSYIPADKLFILGDLAFENINKSKCILYVPNGAKEKYSITEGWKEFKEIVEISDTTGINAVTLYLEKNEVYNLKGQRITENENLTRGIYIVNGRKVLIK